MNSQSKSTFSGNKSEGFLTTARTTGIWYLLMAVSGVLGFMVFHPQIFVSGNPEKTLANLLDLETKARIRLLLEFVIVLTQALTAVWFYRLFRKSNEWAAWALGVWGIVNSVVIMISAIAMASAIGIATSTTIQTVEEKILLIELLQNIISSSWGVGGLFFGLWLLPMGYIIIKSKMMPIWLGRIILLGGIGYLISTFISYAGIELPYFRILTLPATIGEFWMIGYLLIFGIRPVSE
jgi:hypothetical protein